MHALRRLAPRAAGESGFIMVIALLTMTLGLGVVVAVVAAATHSNSATRRTNAAASALAAAQAGEQVALFRLNASGATTGATGSMGNGATYTYSVTSLASSGSACSGLWVQNSSRTLVQDCITSAGSDDGVNERIQTRVVGYTPTVSLYPVNGVLALDGFSAANNVSGTFDIGSNGQMTFNNTISLTGHIYYTTGKFSESQNANQMCAGSCSASPISTPYTVPAVPDSAYAAAATSNNDAAISWPSPFTYTASTHIVAGNGGNNKSVTIPGGTYYFCEMNFDGNATTLNTNGTAANPVVIYMDSPYRSGSGCTAASGGNGTLSGANQFVVNNASGVASNLQIYFYGQPGCTTSCPNNFAPNGTTITADVYAPNSSFTTGNNFTFSGALVIGQLTTNNSFTFNFQSNPGGGSTSTNAAYYPSADTTCIPSTTSGGTAGPC